jgi:predicted PurR-regulated permease PerM
VVAEQVAQPLQVLAPTVLTACLVRLLLLVAAVVAVATAARQPETLVVLAAAVATFLAAVDQALHRKGEQGAIKQEILVLVVLAAVAAAQALWGAMAAEPT